MTGQLWFETVALSPEEEGKIEQLRAAVADEVMVGAAAAALLPQLPPLQLCRSCSKVCHRCF